MPEDYDVHEKNPGKCPRCGMTLIPVTEEEKARFEQVKPERTPPTLYTCPMDSHAHVVFDKPGTCPGCEMKLVPTSTVEHGKKSEGLWHKAHPTAKPAKKD
jgi:hypothetical protein